MISSLLPSIAALGLAALISLALARTRKSPVELAAERRAAARALMLATTVQAFHFGEELATGFHQELGPLFGLPAMPLAFFIGFNLGWLGIWIASVPGLRASRASAFFAAWFLAIAGMINGVAHPLMAIAAQGYFPGLISSVFIGVTSVWLWLRLRQATA